MIYTQKTRKALKLAYDKHHGQFDKAGLPYIHHPLHLAEQMDNEEACVVALLHDIVEDTDVTFEEIEEFGEKIVEVIKLLTKKEDDDYFEYVTRIAKNPIAKQVKLADLKHNSDVTRLLQITPKDEIRIEKYKKAIQILEA